MYKIIAAVLTLATTSIGTAVMPYFSKMVADKNWNSIRSTVKFYFTIIFSIGIPLTVIIYGLSDMIIQSVFQRGSFTAQDTANVSSIQAFFAFQIPFHVAGILIVRLISSLRSNHILLWGAAINLIVNIALNLVFIHFFGLKGIALSTSFVYLIAFIYLTYCSERILKRESLKEIILN